MQEVRASHKLRRNANPYGGSVATHTYKDKNGKRKPMTKAMENEERVAGYISELENKIDDLTNHTDATSATKRQLWYIHVLTGEDTRGVEMTKAEASAKIKELKANLVTVPLTVKGLPVYTIPVETSALEVVQAITERYQEAELPGVLDTIINEISQFKQSLLGAGK